MLWHIEGYVTYCHFDGIYKFREGLPVEEGDVPSRDNTVVPEPETSYADYHTYQDKTESKIEIFRNRFFDRYQSFCTIVLLHYNQCWFKQLNCNICSSAVFLPKEKNIRNFSLCQIVTDFPIKFGPNQLGPKS